MGSTARASANTSTRRARPLQRPGAGLGGRSGGDHVVDHHDLLTPNSASARLVDLESTGDVAAPLVGAEPDLA